MSFDADVATCNIATCRLLCNNVNAELFVVTWPHVIQANYCYITAARAFIGTVLADSAGLDIIAR